ncbi:gliding motility protein GldL [Dysgonomonas sp. 511]|uniref:type IX secretion system motor protein PorL/GldL n=1 Tax=Dysgonomonas sp. 511 TaxID=2302930 RepID=UPI00210814CF|nr:gliding motility protein GldL [Dysgonomonas sp. 511]
MHVSWGNWVLMGGMIVEVIVFLIAGLDYATITAANSDVNANIVVGTGSAIPDMDIPEDDIKQRKVSVASGANSSPGTTGGSSVIVVGGGGTVGSVGAGASISTPTGVVSGGSASIGHQGSPSGNYTPSMSVPASSMPVVNQDLEGFTETVQSLKGVSQELLDAYKSVSGDNGFAENLATLNKNVSGLNEIFSSQLQTITEQMSTIRYINDSLLRMKNIYDGAIGDSYMFKEESAKMTRHIEALNNVYARLLQAMTTNNNNMNNNNF